MKTQFEELMSGLDDVESFLSGEKEGFKVHVPEKVDVKSIRNKLRMTQARFSDVFGFSLDAIKHWEGGRRTPEAPARTLLTVIDKNPAAVLTAASAGGLRCFHRIFRIHTVRYKTIKKTRRSGHYVARASQHGDRSHRKYTLQRLSTFFDARTTAVAVAGAMLTPCLRDAFGTSAFQGLAKVKPLKSAAAEEPSAPVFEPTISTHDSRVSHDFSST
jgi:putative transcriptional regulator